LFILTRSFLLERCHEADVVALIGRWSERRKENKTKKKEKTGQHNE